MPNLIVDIGNTRSKLALYHERKLLGRVKILPRLSRTEVLQFIGKKNIDAVCCSIVGKTPKRVINWLSREFPFTNLNHNTAIPIKNDYGTAKTLGKDRLAAAIGAWGHFPEKNCLIFDSGTCITYDLVTKEGNYLGGGISPGLRTRFKAMNRFTANLPLVDPIENANWLGTNTLESLRAGAQWGLIHEVDGFIRQYKKEYAGLKVLATGGDAEYLAKNLKTKIFVHPNLVLEGLNQILHTI